MKRVIMLLILLNTVAFGIKKEVKVDMKKEGRLLVITLSAEEQARLFKQYKVKKGDTLTKLSNKFEVKIREMVKDNKIKNPNLIIINQELKIEDKKQRKK